MFSRMVRDQCINIGIRVGKGNEGRGPLRRGNKNEAYRRRDMETTVRA